MIKFIHSTLHFKYNSCVTITYGIIHIQATKREEWHICSIHLPLAFTVAVSSSSANSSLTCSPRMLSRTFNSTPSLPTKTQQKISVTTQTHSVIAIFTRLCSQKRHDSPFGSKWYVQTIIINNYLLKLLNSSIIHYSTNFTSLIIIKNVIHLCIKEVTYSRETFDCKKLWQHVS